MSLSNPPHFFDYGRKEALPITQPSSPYLFPWGMYMLYMLYRSGSMHGFSSTNNTNPTRYCDIPEKSWSGLSPSLIILTLENEWTKMTRSRLDQVIRCAPQRGPPSKTKSSLQPKRQVMCVSNHGLSIWIEPCYVFRALGSTGLSFTLSAHANNSMPF